MWALALGFAVIGCAAATRVVKMPEATGGSRADGIVELSYEYYDGEVYEVAVEAALTTAKQRCEAWGYSDATPFGGTKRSCLFHDGDTCTTYFVIRPYQCTGPREIPPSSSH